MKSKYFLRLLLSLCLFILVSNQKAVEIIDEEDFDFNLQDTTVDVLVLSNDLKLSSGKIISRNVSLELNSYSIIFRSDVKIGFTVKSTFEILLKGVTKSNLKITGPVDKIFEVIGGELQITNKDEFSKISIGDQKKELNDYGIHITKGGSLITFGQGISIVGNIAVYAEGENTKAYIRSSGIINGNEIGIKAVNKSKLRIEDKVEIYGEDQGLLVENAVVDIGVPEGQEKEIIIGKNSTGIAVQSKASEINFNGNANLYGYFAGMSLSDGNKVKILNEKIGIKTVYINSEEYAFDITGPNNLVEINGKVYIGGIVKAIKFADKRNTKFVFSKREIIRLSTSLKTNEDTIFQYVKENITSSSNADFNEQLVLYSEDKRPEKCEVLTRFDDYHFALNDKDFCNPDISMEEDEGEDLSSLLTYTKKKKVGDEIILMKLYQGLEDKPELKYICTECEFNSQFSHFHNTTPVDPPEFFIYKGDSQEVSFNFHSQLKRLEKIELIDLTTLEVAKTINAGDLTYVVEDNVHKYKYTFNEDNVIYGSYIPKIIFSTHIINMYDINVYFSILKLDVLKYRIYYTNEEFFEYPKEDFGNTLIFTNISIKIIEVVFNDDKIHYGDITLTNDRKIDFNYTFSEKDNNTMVILVNETDPAYLHIQDIEFNIKYESEDFGKNDYKFSIVNVKLVHIQPSRIVLDEEESTEITLNFTTDIYDVISKIQLIRSYDMMTVIKEVKDFERKSDKQISFNLVKDEELTEKGYVFKVFMESPQIIINPDKDKSLTVDDEIEIDYLLIDFMKLKYDDYNNEIGIAYNQTIKSIQITYENNDIADGRLKIQNDQSLPFSVSHSNNMTVIQNMDKIMPFFTLSKLEFTITDTLKYAGKNTFTFSLVTLTVNYVKPKKVALKGLKGDIKFTVRFSTFLPFLSSINFVNNKTKEKDISVPSNAITRDGDFYFFNLSKTGYTLKKGVFYLDVLSNCTYQNFYDDTTFIEFKDGSGKKKKVNAGVIAGIVVGAVVLIGVVVGVLIYFLKFKKSNSKGDTVDPTLVGVLTD